VRIAVGKSLALVLLAAASAARAQAPAAAPPAAGGAAVEAQVIVPERLLDRQPFDRITLNAANNQAVIETVLLDLPQRRVPNPLPTSGRLQLRQLSQPSVPYEVDWSAIAKIELYEQVLLGEAQRLTAAGEYAEAFDYLAFLTTNYPSLAGLESALEEYLWRDASAAFAAGDGDGAWPALVALYARNPKYPRLANAVQAVSDSLISRRLQQHDYAAARAVLALVERHFPDLELANAARWHEQFALGAQTQLAAARAALAAGDYDAARTAAMVAQAILPEFAEPRELLRQIQRASPEVRVGVTQLARTAPPSGLFGESPRDLEWAASRVAPLTKPRLVDEVAFGAEGGAYATRFGVLETDDAGVETTLRLSPAALGRGLTPDAVSLVLIESAGAAGAPADADLAAALKALRLVEGNGLRVVWKRPPLHPGALLQVPLRRITTAERGPGLWLDRRDADSPLVEARFTRTGPRESAGGRPQIVVERLFADDDAALAALVRGDVDAIDRVPPWQLEQARGSSDIVVVPYALPTVHVLIPNFDNPLLAMREFRRALCYGADRAGIVRDLLLGGQAAAGFVPLSGPFPAGVGLNDPAGYGYDRALAPRPYEPRLAALLATVARTTLDQRQRAERKERGEEVAEPDPTKEPKLPPLAPLTLAYPADPIARVACQALKLQYEKVGVPIRLVELPADGAAASQIPAPDLVYAELAVREPLVDARRLLGEGGLAPRTTALMTAALDELARSENWNDARRRLRDIHRMAHFDLPLIPLWQTVNHLARRSWLKGVGDQPLTLYQNLDDWRKELAEP
jgi:tetratricopeptide (TPR) repeat protein